MTDKNTAQKPDWVFKIAFLLFSLAQKIYPEIGLKDVYISRQIEKKVGVVEKAFRDQIASIEDNANRHAKLVTQNFNEIIERLASEKDDLSVKLEYAESLLEDAENKLSETYDSMSAEIEELRTDLESTLSSFDVRIEAERSRIEQSAQETIDEANAKANALVREVERSWGNHMKRVKAEKDDIQAELNRVNDNLEKLVNALERLGLTSIADLIK